MISFLLRRGCFEFPAILGMNFSENSTKASRKPQAVLMELCKSGAGKDRVFFFVIWFCFGVFCFAFLIIDFNQGRCLPSGLLKINYTEFLKDGD